MSIIVVIAYFAAHLTLMWELVFVMHILNVLCKTLHHLLMIKHDDICFMLYAISFCFSQLPFHTECTLIWVTLLSHSSGQT